VCAALADAGLTPYMPRGAVNAKEAAMTVLDQTKIASVPGTSFYADPVGETLYRLCFAKEDDVLRAGGGGAADQGGAGRDGRRVHQHP